MKIFDMTLAQRQAAIRKRYPNMRVPISLAHLLDALRYFPERAKYMVPVAKATPSRNKREGKYRQKWVPYGLDVNVFRSKFVRGHYA